MPKLSWSINDMTSEIWDQYHQAGSQIQYLEVFLNLWREANVLVCLSKLWSCRWNWKRELKYPETLLLKLIHYQYRNTSQISSVWAHPCLEKLIRVKSSPWITNLLNELATSLFWMWGLKFIVFHIPFYWIKLFYWPDLLHLRCLA